MALSIRLRLGNDLLGDDGTEACALDLYGGIGFPADTYNLSPNILSFPVTICPYHELLALFCLRRKVGGNGLLVVSHRWFDFGIEEYEGSHELQDL